MLWLSQSLVCKVVAGICGKDPNAQGCQENLKRYGFGGAAFAPSPSNGLLNAATKGDAAEVRRMLAAGANPNGRNALGWSPLMLAAAERHLDAVVALLEVKADPNARNTLGRTALMFASSYGDDSIAERLLTAGADPNIVPNDQSGWTALMAAAAGGNTSTVGLLIRHGADPSIKSKGDKTALEIAKSAGNTEIIKILTATGN